MKKLIILSILLSSVVCNAARTITSVKDVNGNILHSVQSGWVVVDETTSAGTEPTALAEDERTKLRVDVAIAAAASGDDEISIFPIPASWNIIRFRSCNITEDTGNVVYEIYFGTLGGGDDCDLVYAGQLNFTSGGQNSSYYQIAFTSGGPYIPQPGNTFTGNTSGETAIVQAVPTAATGSFAAGDATGTIQYRSSTGTFTNSETVATDGTGPVTTDVLTHAASDLVVFEWADTLSATTKSWGSAWSELTPADDTIAESEVDVEGADFMVILASTCTADAKLLCKGY